MEQFDLDLNDDPYLAAPGLWPNIITLENNQIQIEDLIFELDTQIVKLENLGIDYLSQYTAILSIEQLKNYLYIINENYIDIPFIEAITDDYTKSITYFTSLYQFLFVDFIKDIINRFDLNKSEEIRNILVSHINNNLTQLNNLYKINTSLRPELIKNSILLDIFSGDLERFIESFVNVVLAKYLND
jgi:hypothetical protein